MYLVKSKKFISIMVSLVMLCIISMSMVSSAEESISVEVTFPYYGTVDYPFIISSDGNNMVVTFSYTGNPTVYCIMIVDENIGDVWGEYFVPLDGSGNKRVDIPITLPTNQKLGISVNVINMETFEWASNEYTWVILRQ